MLSCQLTMSVLTSQTTLLEIEVFAAFMPWKFPLSRIFFLDHCLSFFFRSLHCLFFNMVFHYPLGTFKLFSDIYSFYLSTQWVDNNIYVVPNSSTCILLFIIAVLDTLQWLFPYINGHYMFSLVSFLTTVTYAIVDMFCIRQSMRIIFKMTSKFASLYSPNILFDSLISILAINRSVKYCLYFFYNFVHRKTFKK